MDTNKQHAAYSRLLSTFVLNVRRPTIVKNKEIFAITKLEPWSIII